ncbi:MAG: hypothetical protein AWU57_465 [Marinobacter sp. T13-3]|nr:MAG: hypothetical protein AWU57_465 [Marinobacter sp. T13-3]
MAVSSEDYMQVHEQKCALQERVNTLEAANRELAGALDVFIEAAEFRARVAGTMGQMQESYDHAIASRDKAASMIQEASATDA